MAQEFSVDLQGQEESDRYVSVTGTVNGVQEAAVVAKDSLPSDPQKRYLALCKALAREFGSRINPEPTAAFTKVTLDD